MLKSFIVGCVFCWSFHAHAFLDFMAKKSEELAKSAMYADAIAELTYEIAPDSALEKGAKQSREDSEKMRQDVQNLYYVGEDAKSIVQGPDLGSENLETNIRASTSYIRKVKSLSLKIAALGSDGLTALNTLQTNQTLEQIRKNQAAEIAISQSYNQKKLRKDALEDSKMRGFIARQRAIRHVSVNQYSNQSSIQYSNPNSNQNSTNP